MTTTSTLNISGKNSKYVKDDRRKLDKILKEIKSIDGKKVAVGIFTGDRREGGSMATIAATHEFGSDKKKIPERSWMRKYFDLKTSTINKFIQVRIKQILDIRLSEKKAIGEIGVWYTGELKKTIISLTSPALKDATVRRKKSTKLLIDTAQMINIIKHKVFKGFFK